MRAFLRPSVVLLLVGVVTVPWALGVGESGHATSQAESQTNPRQRGATGQWEGPIVVVVSDLPELASGATGRGKAITIPRRGIPSGDRQEGAGQPPTVNAIDSQGAGLGAVAGAPALSMSQFEGLDDDHNLSLTGFTVSPPDPQVAVGPNHIFEMVNNVGRIFDKSGTILETYALKDFFQVPTGYLATDPKIIYDALSGRWFAAYISSYDDPLLQDEGLLHIAVSQTSNPTGAWLSSLQATRKTAEPVATMSAVWILTPSS